MSILSNAASKIARSEGDPRIISTGPGSLGASDRLARGLGWFSLALGAAELIAPERITRALGLEGKEALVRAYGLREIMAGVMTLSVEKQAGLWSRVAGDALDVATLLPALHADNPKRGNAGIALAMVLGITTLDVMAARATNFRHRREGGDRNAPRREYRDRSGLPHGVEAARGMASRDFETPADMRADLNTPAAL